MIGVRFSLYPMTDRFVPVILGAVEGLDRLGVEVEVDDVSTCLLGEEPSLFEALRVAFGRAAASGEHVGLKATCACRAPTRVRQAGKRAGRRRRTTCRT